MREQLWEYIWHFNIPVEIPGIANSSFLRTAINSIRKKIMKNQLILEGLFR